MFAKLETVYQFSNNMRERTLWKPGDVIEIKTSNHSNKYTMARIIKTKGYKLYVDYTKAKKVKFSIVLIL